MKRNLEFLLSKPLPPYQATVYNFTECPLVLDEPLPPWDVDWAQYDFIVILLKRRNPIEQSIVVFGDGDVWELGRLVAAAVALDSWVYKIFSRHNQD